MAGVAGGEVAPPVGGATDRDAAPAPECFEWPRSIWTPTTAAIPSTATPTRAAMTVAGPRRPLRAFGGVGGVSGGLAITSVGAGMTEVAPAVTSDAAVLSWLPSAAAKSAHVA